MSQDFWFPKVYAGVGYNPPNNEDRCIVIKLPLVCPQCGKTIRISGSGSPDTENGIIDSCHHTETYYRLWSLRLIDNSSQGCVCMRCNSRNPYAIPNRPNDKYLCFECRH